nr:MAG TPA: hypothetical protein [Caudoviricetes sp.]
MISVRFMCGRLSHPSTVRLMSSGMRSIRRTRMARMMCRIIAVTLIRMTPSSGLVRRRRVLRSTWSWCSLTGMTWVCM